ncbi:MAG: 3-isopropylmalate/(R)-2-methylmalate dehydratase small subunit [Mycobacterium sp.]|nr:3-isopropylmalate/(R)-2-methylmalate dehydratase small subunit [Mycobacterium sp.]
MDGRQQIRYRSEWADGKACALGRRASGSVARLPDLILDIIAECGVMPRLAAQGYLPAELAELLRSSTVAMRGEGSGA